MSIPGFIARNALRNKRRALLSVLSLAISLFLLVALKVAVRELTTPAQDVGTASRVIVRNKISLGNLLPARQLQTLQKIPGIEAITPFTWYGGKYKGENALFAQFAVDPRSLTRILGEAKLVGGDFETFYTDKTACLLGQKTAEKFNLKVGDKMPMTGTFWPFDLDLKIAAIYAGTLDDRNLFFNHKYLDDLSGSGGQVGTWWVLAKSLEDVPKVIEAINKAFANTSAEVKAETERAFQLGFVSMWGNIQALVTSISSVVVFTLVLVSASTMSMAVRERFRELAILKALGFRRRELFAFILAESFGLSALGAILGIGGAWITLTRGPIARALGEFLPVLEVTPRIVGFACAVAALLGVVASIAPSIAVARMSVVEGLKTLD